MEESYTPTTVGKVLRAERERLNLTQKELGDKVGTSQQNIGGIEKGKSTPSDDLLDKLIELFGPGSPIAYTARRGEVRPPAVPEERVSYSRKTDGPAQEKAPAYWQRQMGEIPALYVSQSQKESVQALRGVVPSRLQEYVDRFVMLPDNNHMPGIAYKADYLSDGLCMEVKRVVGTGNVMHSARLGMHQVMLFRKMLERDAGALPLPPRVFALGLVMDPVASTVTGRQIARAKYEAALTGVELQFFYDMKDVGAYINAVESGSFPEMEDDYY